MTRVDSAGVALVTSSGADRPLDWRFEATLTLGGDEFYHVGRWNVGSDEGGVIHVLDRDGKRVLRYTPEGRPLPAVGAPGSGPGEMEWPNTLVVSPDGRFTVSDFGRGRTITWGPDGTLLGEDPEGLKAQQQRPVSSGQVVTLSVWSEGESAERLVHVGSAGDSTELATVSGPTRAISLESCGMSFSGLRPIFAPHLRWDAAGDRVALVTDAAYEIQVYDAGAPAMRLRRDLAPTPANREYALAELGEGMRVGTAGGLRVCDPGEVVEQRGVASHLPLVETVTVDPDGRVWAQRFVAGEEPGAIDVFDADGAYVGTLPAGTPFPVGFLPDGRVMVRQTDELDVQRLVVGRFVPAGAAD